MEDDVFGDLVSKKTVSTLEGSTKQKATPPAVETKDESVGTSSVLCMGQEELEQLLAKTVTDAVDKTFGKFAKSLRTVMDDMSKRIESNNAAQAQMSSELRCGLKELQEAAEQQLDNNSCRFTSLEHGLREVERGVQTMRDKIELHEAQAMLAKYDPSPPASTVAKEQGGPAPQAAEPAPAPAPAPTAAAAPPPDAAAPPPLQAMLPPPMQQAVPQLPHAGPPAPAMQAPHIPVASAPTMQLPHLAAPPPAMLGQQPGQLAAYGPQPGQEYYPYHEMAASAPAAGLQQAPAPVPDSYQQQPLLQPLTQPFQQQHQQHAPQQQQMPPPQQMLPLQQMLPQQPLLLPLSQPFPQQQQPQQHVPQQSMAQSLPTMQYSHAPQSMARVSAPVYMPGPSSHQAPPQSPGSTLSMYPVSRMPSYPAAPMQLQPSYSGGMQAASPGPSAAAPQSKTTSRAVPLDQIITDITNMGFERAKVLSLVTHLQKNGQAMDLNVIIDKLTRG